MTLRENQLCVDPQFKDIPNSHDAFGGPRRQGALRREPDLKTRFKMKARRMLDTKLIATWLFEIMVNMRVEAVGRKGHERQLAIQWLLSPAGSMQRLSRSVPKRNPDISH